MRVVGSDDDQGVGIGTGLGGRTHSIGERDGLIQCAEGIAGVVGHINATAFHHQEITFGIARQHLHGDPGHLGQAGLAGAVLGAFVFVVHVVGLEQSEQLRGVVEVERGPLACVPDVLAMRVALLPLLHQVAAIQALAALVGIFGVALRDRFKVLATTAQRHLNTIAVVELDELAGDVTAASGAGLIAELGVRFPVALGDVRVGCAWRGMSQPRVGNYAGGEPRGFCQLKNRGQRRTQSLRTIPAFG